MALIEPGDDSVDVGPGTFWKALSESYLGTNWVLQGHGFTPSLVVDSVRCIACRGPLASLALQPPHSANRHDADCRGAGDGRVGGKKLIGRALFSA